MYAVLDKYTIKNEILPHLSKVKRGYATQSCLIDVVNAILYKLKAGCQWILLPVESPCSAAKYWSIILFINIIANRVSNGIIPFFGIYGSGLLHNDQYCSDHLSLL